MGTTNEIMSYFSDFLIGQILNKTMHIFPKHYFLFIVFTAFVYTSLQFI